ncbi:hypothetical protein QE364_003853 [Nocardioides zeae]|uniref:Uncharacterized protein n=1 Tax=Nocardioides zeae TaxID=1457234 RepID=A0ACC6INL7_9ACTN|nr:hypothetical protein [Nocardioides zeae]MDR6174401.1 hypothetical protein [Nocardioides zeae]MDR6212122.1 hypothetical protein [Nocardioides zeae]
MQPAPGRGSTTLRATSPLWPSVAVAVLLGLLLVLATTLLPQPHPEGRGVLHPASVEEPAQHSPGAPTVGTQVVDASR